MGAKDLNLKVAAINTYDWDVKTGKFLIHAYSDTVEAKVNTLMLTRRLWNSNIHPDDKKKISQSVLQPNNKNRYVETEYRVRTVSGDYKWFLDYSTVIDRDWKDEPCRIKGILIDTLFRGIVEKVLRNWDSEIRTVCQRLENEKSAILEGLRGLVSVRYIDRQLRIVWSNSEVDQSLSFTNPTKSLDHCYEIVQKRTEPCPNCHVKKVFRTCKIQEKQESRLDDGRCFTARAIPINDNAGKIVGVLHFALDITRHKQIEEGLKITHEFLCSFLDNSPTPFMCTHEGCIESVNRAWESVVGVESKQAIGKSLSDIFPTEVANRMDHISKKVLRTGTAVETEESIECPTGLHHFYVVKFRLQDVNRHNSAVGAIFVDVTDRRTAEQQLKKRETELRARTEQLSDMNAALRVLLRQMEDDKREIEERVVCNVRELVLPYIHKLQGMHLNETQMNYLEILETRLNDIITPYFRKVVSDYPHLTPREIQVLTLVREGKTNKEIANLLCVSVNAVEIHRFSIRKKLGIQNRKVNLRSYLLSMKSLTA